MVEKQIKRSRKQIDRNLEVTIMNNTHGGFYYTSPSGETVIELEAQGDTDYLSYGELRKMRKYIDNFSLVICGVDDPDISIMDIAKALHIDKLYKAYFECVSDYTEEEMYEEESIDLTDFEEFIKTCDVDELKELMKGKLRSQIIQTTVDLYRAGQLTDYQKMTLVEKTRPVDLRENFWKDIDSSSSIE